MGTFYDETIFTNVKKSSNDPATGEFEYHGILVASKLNQKNGQGYKLLDAVDIDWNGAWVSSLSTYMHTSEDLVRVLNELNKSNDIGQIDKNIELIWNQLNEITSTYVTYTSLYDLLSTSYQAKLVPGEFITIDNTSNVITTYNLASYEYLSRYYTSLDMHNDLKYILENNYYTKPETERVVLQYVKTEIDKVIDGADDAFDTLKEVADWILDQNRYEPCTPQEVIDALNDPNNKYEYYYLDQETGKYVKVTDPNTVVTDGSVQYYRLENYLTDVKNLLYEVTVLKETVGTSYLSYYYDQETESIVYLNTYTYTGMKKDIYDLKQYDNYITDYVENINSKADTAISISRESYGMAYTAYGLAYTAYDIASYSLDISLETIITAKEAYVVAKKASEDVGTPTIIGQGWVEINYEDINSYVENGITVFYYDEDSDSYITAEPPYVEGFTHYIFDGNIEATGLTKRVEDVETDIEILDKRVDEAKDAALKSLYNLSVNNDGSTYIQLNINPHNFTGNPNRVLSITTNEGVVNPETGEVVNHGVATIDTIYDVFTYASSWQILDNSNEI